MKQKNKHKKEQSDVKIQKELLLECVDLEKWYETSAERISVLNKITFSCSTGDFISVFGVKGSGKTTLLNCISGLEKCSRGKVYVRDELVELYDDAELAELYSNFMSFLPVEKVLFDVLNVKENIELNMMKAVALSTDKILGLVGLNTKILMKYAKQLSRFEQVQVLIAQALVNKPKILLIDSLDARLNKEEKIKYLELLSRINHETNTAIVLATDDLDVALRTKKILRLTDGKLM